MIKTLFFIAIAWIISVDQPWIFEYIVENIIFVIFALLVTCVSRLIFLSIRQIKFIENYHFPESLDKKVLNAYPHLSKEDLVIVKQELKHFFKITNTCKPKTVAMPSRVVDVLWHEFILHTKNYHAFCDRAFGHHFHHDPFPKEMASRDIKASLQRAWILSCKTENINPEKPERLPVLFSIDSSLNITDGNKFSSDDQLKCIKGSFAGVGAVALVAIVDSGDAGGGDGGCGGGGCGGCGG